MAETSRIITSRQLDSNYATGAYSETMSRLSVRQCYGGI
jgi:hypothetical protein